MWRRSLIFGVIVLGIGGVGALMLPRTIVDEVTPRSTANGVIADLSPMKDKIAKNAMHRATLKGAGVEVSALLRPTKPIDANDIYISDDGVLVGFNYKFGVTVIMEPRLAEYAVSWKCRIYPTTVKVATCHD